VGREYRPGSRVVKDTAASCREPASLLGRWGFRGVDPHGLGARLVRSEEPAADLALTAWSSLHGLSALLLAHAAS
jgi:hypothetical protein